MRNTSRTNKISSRKKTDQESAFQARKELQNPEMDETERHINSRKKKMSKLMMALLITLAVLLATGVGIAAYTYQQLSLMRDTGSLSNSSTPEPDQAETLDPNLPSIDNSSVENALPAVPAVPIVQTKSTYNILLYGLDTRSPTKFSGARTDVMMLVTIDTDKKSIKLTSFMRDILVKIPGNGTNRLNTAFVFGGPTLATQTISQTFGVKADWYAIINFWAFADVIDALGGVEINVNSDEIFQLNKSLTEINTLDKTDQAPNVRKSGLQRLNGRQAVAYMRIRHTGQGDFERTQRQRTVMAQLTAQMSKLSLGDAINLAGVLPKYTRTNMTQAEILDMANKLYSIRGAKVQELRIPADGTYKLGNYKGKSIILVDVAKNIAKLTEFLQK